MGKLIESLGIDPWILFAQLFNFVILIGLLYTFGYKKILSFVNERTQKIEDGLKNAENATSVLAKAQEDQERVINEARAEGRGIVSEARAQAEKQAQELLAKNALQIETLHAKHVADMDSLKKQMMNEVRAEASQLVFAVVEKILREKITTEADKKLVEKYLAEQTRA